MFFLPDGVLFTSFFGFFPLQEFVGLSPDKLLPGKSIFGILLT